ncbi:hypothetical protein E2C01_001720 [Portunus trituberculatus]|uniref:Uncharacterized protein n=1 Tax=Portunus trituberculatus TaxID=210409 RepID=A0A5B7CIS4_PORTR|nr:hypothetical protein [Portunus trituberculatus]
MASRVCSNSASSSSFFSSLRVRTASGTCRVDDTEKLHWALGMMLHTKMEAGWMYVEEGAETTPQTRKA